jgi:annexin A7/11
MDMNYENDAKVLRESMKGSGTDEDAIISLTASKNNTQRQELRKAYKASFGRDLIDDLKDELGGNFEKVVVAMYLSPVEYDVVELYKAFKGMGTDEDTVSEIIGSRSNYRLKEIAGLYKVKYDEDFEKRLTSEVSGDYRKLLISIMQCGRNESKEVDSKAVEEDCKVLYNAGEGKWGTDEEVFNRIFAIRSSYHLRELNSMYTKQRGKNLLEVVDSEFSGDVRVLLKTILHSHINPADYYATRIYKACKGWGTNDGILVRSLVVMDEVYLGEIKKIYQSKFGMTLRDQINDEVSGDYKNMLLALVDTP